MYFKKSKTFKSFIIKIKKFFNTQPIIKSDTVLNIQRNGKSKSLHRAIRNEKKRNDGSVGTSEDGSIEVRRIGI